MLGTHQVNTASIITHIYHKFNRIFQFDSIEIHIVGIHHLNECIKFSSTKFDEYGGVAESFKSGKLG